MENQAQNQAAESPARTASAPQNTSQSTAQKSNTAQRQPTQPQANGSAQASNTAQARNTVQASTATAKPSPAMTDVLADSAVPPVVCEWLTCLRRPALSMQYSVKKRHVPDLDNDTGATAQSGMDSDDMSLTGGFTIRYFDLAAGALVLATTACLIRLCCAMKRKIF